MNSQMTGSSSERQGNYCDVIIKKDITECYAISFKFLYMALLSSSLYSRVAEKMYIVYTI